MTAASLQIKNFANTKLYVIGWCCILNLDAVVLRTFIGEYVYDSRDEGLGSLGTRLDQREQLWRLHAHASDRCLQHAQDGPLHVGRGLNVHVRQPVRRDTGRCGQTGRGHTDALAKKPLGGMMG